MEQDCRASTLGEWRVASDGRERRRSMVVSNTDWERLAGGGRRKDNDGAVIREGKVFQIGETIRDGVLKPPPPALNVFEPFPARYCSSPRRK